MEKKYVAKTLEVSLCLEVFAEFYPNENTASDILCTTPKAYRDYFGENNRILPKTVAERLVESIIDKLSHYTNQQLGYEPHSTNINWGQHSKGLKEYVDREFEPDTEESDKVRFVSTYFHYLRHGGSWRKIESKWENTSLDDKIKQIIPYFSKFVFRSFLELSSLSHLFKPVEKNKDRTVVEFTRSMDVLRAYCHGATHVIHPSWQEDSKPAKMKIELVRMDGSRYIIHLSTEPRTKGKKRKRIIPGKNIKIYVN